MKDTLDFTQNEFKMLLDKSTDLVLNQYANLQNQKGYHSYEQAEVESWFDEAIPEDGMPVLDLLEFVQEKILSKATGNAGPNMYGYVMSGGNQIGIIADKLASSINQNVTKWHLAPSMTEVDKRVIQWVGKLIGFDDCSAGFIGSSGSSANLDGLTIARNIFFAKLNIINKGLFGIAPFTIYCSEETHNSIDKSVQLLGIGVDHLRKISTNDDYTIDILALENQIKIDIKNGFQPFCVVGNAGTINTGAIDDLNSISKIAKSHNMWFHIDGAYGGLAASLESKKDLYHGIHLADSIALDFHKWLYQPFEVGCVLVKDWKYLNQTYFKKADYLDKTLEKGKGRLEFNEHHFLLSRSAKSLKVWMSLKAYGSNRIKEMIQKDITLASYLCQQIENSDDFELIADSQLAMSCFHYKGTLTNKKEIIELNKQLIPALEEDGRIFITGSQLKGEFVLRACLINHRKNQQTTDYLLQVIRDVGNKLITNH